MTDESALMTISSPGPKPDIRRVAEILGVASDAVDPSFGVVLIDPKRHLYAVQVRASALPQSSSGSDASPYRGPFSNPRIQGFGPIR